MSPLRIVHCFRSPVGGIFRHVRDLVEAHHAHGHQIGIVCDSTTGGTFEDSLFASIEPFLGLGISRVAMQRHVGIGDFAAAWRTFGEVRRMRPDIIHGHGSKGGVYSRAFGTAMRLGGRRVGRIYSPHGGVLHYDAASKGGRVLFTAERLMERVTDHLVFVSEHERETYRRKVGPIRAASSLVYNGLREEEFEETGSAPDAADFLYVGMMRDLKGPDIFLDALASARTTTGRNVSAVMVGAGDDLPRYREQAARLAFGDSVRFLDPMPARTAFPLGRTIVVPSRAEAMPYIVLEALAAGRPMIASAVGGIPEILGPESAALVQPDAAHLAARMCAVLADEAAHAARMPDRALLRRRFGADVMAAEIERIYLSVAPMR